MMKQELRSPLKRGVLVLNRNWYPIRVISHRRAFAMLFAGIADVLDDWHGDYQSYDFSQWAQLSPRLFLDARAKYFWMRTVRVAYAVPKIVRATQYCKIPPSSMRLNRINLMARDRHTCQYCGTVLLAKQLTLDHVIPKSRGGQMSWSNIVCCCKKCNVFKGRRTPDEARMRLLREPRQPHLLEFMKDLGGQVADPSWRPFLPD
jgi:5-methylcytosine-specific restriction endonuclease McrA